MGIAIYRPVIAFTHHQKQNEANILVIFGTIYGVVYVYDAPQLHSVELNHCFIHRTRKFQELEFLLMNKSTILLRMQKLKIF